MKVTKLIFFLLLFSMPLYTVTANTDPGKKAIENLQDINKNGQDGDIKSNIIVKTFEKLYGPLDSNLSKGAVTAIVGIAILGLFMLRSSPIIGLIMVLAPTAVYQFVEKGLDMLK